MKKYDKNLLIYLFVLTLSWVFIIIYLIKCENEKQNTQKFDFRKLEKVKLNKMSILNFKSVEPLKENRFLIKLQGIEVRPYLFRKYKIFNEGEELIFITEFYETVEYSFNPKDFFNITGVSIEYLSPVGDVVNALDFQVKGSNFKRSQSYKNDELQINKLRFIVDKDTMNLRFKPTSEDEQQGNG